MKSQLDIVLCLYSSCFWYFVLFISFLLPPAFVLSFYLFSCFPWFPALSFVSSSLLWNKSYFIAKDFQENFIQLTSSVKPTEEVNSVSWYFSVLKFRLKGTEGIHSGHHLKGIWAWKAWEGKDQRTFAHNEHYCQHSMDIIILWLQFLIQCLIQCLPLVKEDKWILLKMLLLRHTLLVIQCILGSEWQTRFDGNSHNNKKRKKATSRIRGEEKLPLF